MTTRKLGTEQASILDAIRRHGGYPGGIWVWKNHSTAVRLLDSLVKRGLVAVYEETVKHPIYKQPHHTYTRRVYRAVKTEGE
jgi:DNA-binding PadR family transcriptional regulator